MTKILLPEKKRHYQCPELQEGIDPSEYNGLPIKLPVFDKGTQYGMWCKLCRPYKEKMFDIMRELIPEEYRENVKIINKVPHLPTADPFNLCSTTGWKYTPMPGGPMPGR